MSKRVMRVLMIGLVAMLGVKAAAHTVWVPPLKPRNCSVASGESETTPEAKPFFETLKEVPKAIVESTELAIAELVATTEKLVVSCVVNGSLTEETIKEPFVFVDTVPSTDWKFFEKEALVELKISDEQLKEFVAIKNPEFCRDPKVQVVKLSSLTYNVYECAPPPRDPVNSIISDEDSCESKILVSSWKLVDCELPRGADPGADGKCIPFDCRRQKDSQKGDHPL